MFGRCHKRSLEKETNTYKIEELMTYPIKESC